MNPVTLRTVAFAGRAQEPDGNIRLSNGSERIDRQKGGPKLHHKDTFLRLRAALSQAKSEPRGMTEEQEQGLNQSLNTLCKKIKMVLRDPDALNTPDALYQMEDTFMRKINAAQAHNTPKQPKWMKHKDLNEGC